MEHQKIDEKEREFLSNLFEYADTVFNDAANTALTEGIPYPMEGLAPRFQRELGAEDKNYQETIASLRQKELIDIVEKESTLELEPEEAEKVRETGHSRYIRLENPSELRQEVSEE